MLEEKIRYLKKQIRRLNISRVWLTNIYLYGIVVSLLRIAMKKFPFNKMLKVWNRTKHIPSQKEFALNVLTETPFNSILFKARKNGRDPKEIWLESSYMIYHTLFKTKGKYVHNGG